jgi:hypothetical protein
MKKTAFLGILVLGLFVSSSLVGVISLAQANPGPATQIPPVVDVPEMQIKTQVIRTEKEALALVDLTYTMKTRYGYGDSFQTRNWGMNTLVNPEPYVEVNVVYNELDAYYPIPPNATNVSFKIEDNSLNWTLGRQHSFHLFDNDLSELTWKIKPVPDSFQIKAHYEVPLQKTPEIYSYLGEYALIIPLEAQFGLEGTASNYNDYLWFDNSTADFSIQTDEDFNDITAYSIDGLGTLEKLNSTLTRQDKTAQTNFEISIADLSNSTTRSIHGTVVILNSQQGTTEQKEQNTPTIPVTAAAAIALILAAIATIATVIYLKKRQ